MAEFIESPALVAEIPPYDIQILSSEQSQVGSRIMSICDDKISFGALVFY